MRPLTALIFMINLILSELFETIRMGQVLYKLFAKRGYSLESVSSLNCKETARSCNCPQEAKLTGWVNKDAKAGWVIGKDEKTDCSNHYN